ncbi:PadR family transcriptional regulator [Arthrobacter sp. ISL-95]|uniref:PadR family transcriptional regulator n=1 Tax=Arthrobacter sp. ISL-95 TaxID=2819116 RepID=UPI001BE94507|nr:helix-turn-helix transcriptional regulator [Arthrobacter sp. ISL-95]
MVFAVLAVLRRGPAHAYEITRQLRASHELLACESDLYAIMNRLGRQGLVDHKWELSPTGPPRKCYQLTNEGFEALEHRHATWRELRKSLLELLETGSSSISGPNSRRAVPKWRTE